VFAVYIYTRRPQTRERVIEAWRTGSDWVKTDVFHLPHGQVEPRQAYQDAKAHLMVVSGDDLNRNPIAIVARNVKMGRDNRLVDIVFSDRSVSRLHARISEVQNGQFMIYDEGSASGTYVNHQPVGMQGHLLQDDDVINLGGRVGLRFKVRTVDDGTQAFRLDEPETLPAATEPVVEEDDYRDTRIMGREAPERDQWPEPDDTDRTEPYIGGGTPPR
jgi:pSer/pThr/pTyr-binding forkhead associated (FHA) protein